MYCPSKHCLCRTMQAKSRQVWDDLLDAEALGTPYHEDTVTQRLALHLNRHHPAENRVYVFKRAVEGKNGSDFIWIFFDESLDRYFPVAVQAKRLYASQRYEAFQSDQVHKIRQYAQVAGALPIYLTYNYPPVVGGLWRVWQVEGRPWPIRALDYQRDLGLIFFHAKFAAGVSDRQLAPSDIAQSGRPMWLPFCTCTDTCYDDALGNFRKALIARLDDEDALLGKIHGTSQILRSWKSGEAVEENQMMEGLQLHQIAVDQEFTPSFVLGTTLGI